MSEIIWEILIVLVLTFLNGFFSVSEIALISIRKTRVAALAKRGNRRAQIVEQLQRTPESLFATIQVGISVITIVASAFAGASMAAKLSEYIGKIHSSFISHHAYGISFVLVVALVSYVSLILGELVPKSLGLRYAETFSLLAAYPIFWLSKISMPVIKFLNFSSGLVLRPFKQNMELKEPKLSEEEIRTLIAEGRRAGTIDPHEHSIIENVFEFSDLSVGKIMIPRTQITAFDINLPAEEIILKSIESGYSRIPIYQDTLNNIVGILYTKRLLVKLGEGLHSLTVQDFLVPPYFVPNAMQISEVLQRLQKRKSQMALVTDEHGEIEGLVTLEDILEEIVGDITDETDEAKKDIVKQSDGSFMVAGEVSVLDFNKYFNSELPEDQDYTTVSGLILQQLGRFPKAGDVVVYEPWEFTVKEATLRTVKFAQVRKK